MREGGGGSWYKCWYSDNDNGWGKGKEGKEGGGIVLLKGLGFWYSSRYTVVLSRGLSIS